MMESVIKWQTGTPEQSGRYLVTLSTGEVTVQEWYNPYTSSPYWLEEGGEVVAWCDFKDAEPYKEGAMEDKGTLIQIDLTRELCVANEVEVILGDYEFVLKDGKTYFIKKNPRYPKTYGECCEVLGIEEDLWFVYEDIDDNHIKPACISNYRKRRLDLYHNLEKLIICRDAYWKIAGDQMELVKPWKPDWEKADERKYCIVNTEGNITKWVQKTTNKILAFPTEEIRYAFYENFKELIEQCKELL